jgi:NADPH-dependent 2,4-dienoyl-CoA reductase/sulfur reductase-like enzyme
LVPYKRIGEPEDIARGVVWLASDQSDYVWRDALCRWRDDIVPRLRRGRLMPQSATSPRPPVVVVGTGFGGLEAARRLARSPVDVTVIDRHNYHLFQPLLYQVATAALSPADIAEPIRVVLRRQQNATVLLDEVGGGDTAARRVETPFWGSPELRLSGPGDRIAIRRFRPQ